MSLYPNGRRGNVTNVILGRAKLCYRGNRKEGRLLLDFNRSPFLVIWEVTRACALKCLHCRAEAQYHRDPRELSTEEGKALIRQIREMGAPLLVFTGGDPLMRDDLFELAVYAKEQGLLVSLTPSATPRVTEKAMRQAKEIGLDRWAFSLDGSTPEIHDAFRGTRGSFALTMRAIETLRRLGMPLQINTTVSRYNLDDLPNIARLLEEMGVVLWSVFFLVPTGRGKLEDMISAEAHERVFHWLADLAERVPFDIKTTAAPHYRRVLLQRAKAKAKTAAAGGAAQEAPSFAATAGGSRSDGRLPVSGGGSSGALDANGAAGAPPWLAGRQRELRAPRAVNDGNGFVFVSHIGEVYPSGFLPIACGNVRERPLADIYRHHPTFVALRDPERLKGKCGVCEYRTICGGSRARAYAVTGDPLASDPSCAYVPPAWAKRNGEARVEAR